MITELSFTYIPTDNPNININPITAITTNTEKMNTFKCIVSLSSSIGDADVILTSCNGLCKLKETPSLVVKCFWLLRL